MAVELRDVLFSHPELPYWVPAKGVLVLWDEPSRFSYAEKFIKLSHVINCMYMQLIEQ